MTSRCRQAVEDPDAASKVRRVVCVSVFIMILNVICYAVPFALTKTPTTIIMLLGFGFGIPACGYFGARNRSKALVGCFWCCNGCNLAILIALLIISSIFLALFAFILQFLPGYGDCCNQFSACDWNATSTAAGCQSCAINQTDAPVVYMEGSDMCAARGGEPTPPSAFAYLVARAQGTEEDVYLSAADSGSGEEETVCLNQASCQIVDRIKDWRVTRPIVGIFLALFIVLMIPTVSPHPLHAKYLC